MICHIWYFPYLNYFSDSNGGEWHLTVEVIIKNGHLVIFFSLFPQKICRATLCIRLIHFYTDFYLIISRHDSKVTDSINYDLLATIRAIQAGEKSCPELLGYSIMSKTKDSVPTALFKDGCWCLIILRYHLLDVLLLVILIFEKIFIYLDLGFHSVFNETGHLKFLQLIKAIVESMTIVFLLLMFSR